LKPALGLDVDGVIADFSSYALAEINRVLGTSHTTDDCTSWDFGDCISEAAATVVDEMMGRGDCYGKLEPFAGALDCVKRLVGKYDVFVVTSLPPVRAAHQGRENWLWEHGFGWYVKEPTVIAHGNYKATVARRWPMVAFVEDKASTAKDVAAKAGIASYIVARPYNSRNDLVHPNMERGSLEQITEWLLA
jgi:5'(3')-deoxyribonucleotidase